MENKLYFNVTAAPILIEETFSSSLTHIPSFSLNLAYLRFFIFLN
jgi:hypothetical protein